MSSSRRSSRRTRARSRASPKRSPDPRARESGGGAPLRRRPGAIATYNPGRVALRLCLVTPFAWSQPRDVNGQVAGAAAELRRLGHDVTVLAPSTRAADLRAGRRALVAGTVGDVVAVGPAMPISRRSRVGVPVGVRANLR